MTSFILMFLFQSVASAQSGCGKPNPTWTNCKSDSDCVSYADMCGQMRAYNGQFIAEIETYNKCMAPIVDCVNPSKDPLKDAEKAVCKNKKCDVVAPPPKPKKAKST